MGIVAKKIGGDFELAPAGAHMSRCMWVVDLGTQETAFGPKRKVLIGWELSNEQMADGRPFMASNRYTLNLHEKSNLRIHLESWRGVPFSDEELEGFDLDNILAAPCMLSVIHTEGGERTYANVQSVMAIPKGTKPPELVNETVSFSLDEFDRTAYDALPDWLKDTIAKSPEFKALFSTQKKEDEAAFSQEEMAAASADGDIPF